MKHNEGIEHDPQQEQLEKLQSFFNKEVWIKRSSGDWQKAKVVQIKSPELVLVQWPHEKRAGEFQEKVVDSHDLLTWQEELGPTYD
jgi:hypothetical protein